MTSLSPTATNMPYLAYHHVQKGKTTHLEIPPKPRVFSKATLHLLLIAQSFIGHLPEVTPGDPRWTRRGRAARETRISSV